MAFIQVVGGRHLFGELMIQGSKNAVLPILAASILHKGITKIKHCPKITDVYSMIKLMESIGCIISWEQENLVINATDINYNVVDKKYVGTMRSSIILLGALLGRNHSVTISYPGGCAIGARPIDLHINAIRKMNVNVIENEEFIFCSTAEIKGANIKFDKNSVGATENVLLTAALANGITVIENAAIEPEITELCRFLIKMGVTITGVGTTTLKIEGAKELRDVEYSLVPDRIVMATYMAAVAGTGGDVTLKGVCAYDNVAVINVLRKMGCRIGLGKDYINICSHGRPNAVSVIETLPYPGFPTDMQSQMLSVLSIANGTSVIVENIFESRYRTVSELIKMGADIQIYDKVAVISGVDSLYGSELRAYDLRGGAGLVIAALMANGVSLIRGVDYIERGYEDICGDLKKLGADIGKVNEEALLTTF